MRSLMCLLFFWWSTASGQAQPPERKPIPPEARRVLAHILKTGRTFPGYVGGRTFQNRERRLPRTTLSGIPIRYREWDIHPKVPGRSRGPERLVTGDNDRAWYTSDHYRTFQEMQ